MNAVTEPTPFTLPKKPRVKAKDAPPDQRKVAVIPIRVTKDKTLTLGMLRVLLLVCSYANRAGITWVSQKRVAEDLGVSRQAVTRQLGKLQKAGYIVVVAKGFRAERSNTLRVIFDPSVDTETAIAVTSAQEDTRSPAIKEKQMQDMTPDKEGQAKVAQMISKVLKPINQQKEYSMPKEGDTVAVKKIKEGMRKAQSKRTQKQPLDVANEKALDDANQQSKEDSIGNIQRLSVGQRLEVAPTNQEHIDEVYKGCISKEDLKHLKSSGLSDEDIKINFECLRDAYKAEGLPLPSKGLVDQILSMGK